MSKVFFDETSERLLLGTMLLDNKCIGDVISKLTPEMFYNQKHRIIFENIIRLYKSGVNADICSLNAFMMNNGLIEKAGGTVYIADLTSDVIGCSNAEFYMNNVIRHAQSRALKATLSEGLGKLGSSDNAELIMDIEDRMFRISAATTATKIWTPEELATEYNEYLKYNEETCGEEKGIKVGFPTLDRMTDGFQSEDVIIIGARPSIGKTALGISMMQNP